MLGLVELYLDIFEHLKEEKGLYPVLLFLGPFVSLGFFLLGNSLKSLFCSFSRILKAS